MVEKDWFTLWFNTPYYHTLYQHRDDTDAEFFMKNITNFLHLPQHTHILDLPCGKGRHSVFLNSLGYQVTGADLSVNSIEFAKKHENHRLKFEVFDMRKPFSNKYDAIFNLFTSFGYFDADEDDILVLQNMKNGLRKGGYLVFDFLNAIQVAKNLVMSETKSIDGIDFQIQREIKDNFILKHISFFADNQQHCYTERVKYLDYKKIQSYFEQVGLEIKHVFGDYNLTTFEAETSNRLIYIAS